MNVTNVNGTSGANCKCGSWLDHWRKFSSQPLSKWCSERQCIGAPEVGAHVQKDSVTDRGWYIVPLCKAHNGEKGKSLEILSCVELVSANVGQTCGK